MTYPDLILTVWLAGGVALGFAAGITVAALFHTEPSPDADAASYGRHAAPVPGLPVDRTHAFPGYRPRIKEISR